MPEWYEKSLTPEQIAQLSPERLEFLRDTDPRYYEFYSMRIPLLTGELESKYPGVEQAVMFVDAVYKPKPGEYPPFKMMDISSTPELVDLLIQGNQVAIKLCRDIADILHF